MVKFLFYILNWDYNAYVKPARCETCLALREQIITLQCQLDVERLENQRLLDTIINFVKPVAIPVEQTIKAVEPLRPLGMAWNQRRRLLENESREEAKALASARRNNQAIGASNESINKLENELGLSDDLVAEG